MPDPTDHDTGYAYRVQAQQWYQTAPAAVRLRQQLAHDMAVILDEWFGYHLLIIGIDTGIDVGRMTRVRHRIRIIPDASSVEERQGESCIVSLDEELPVDSESVDVVVLMHALDFSVVPHQLLREVHRVLMPSGHLLIFGENRHALRSLWRGLKHMALPAKYRPVRLPRSAPGPHQLVDWLHLLDFVVAPIRHKLIVPSSGRGRIGRWMAKLDDWLVAHNVISGSVFLLYANKTVRGHINQRRVERVGARLMGLPVAKPVVGTRGAVSQHVPRQAPSPTLRSVD